MNGTILKSDRAYWHLVDVDFSNCLLKDPKEIEQAAGKIIEAANDLIATTYVDYNVNGLCSEATALEMLITAHHAKCVMYSRLDKQGLSDYHKELVEKYHARYELVNKVA